VEAIRFDVVNVSYAVNAKINGAHHVSITEVEEAIGTIVGPRWARNEDGVLRVLASAVPIQVN